MFALLLSTTLRFGPTPVLGHELTTVKGLESFVGGRVIADLIETIFSFNLEIFCFLVAFVVIRCSMVPDARREAGGGKGGQGKDAEECKGKVRISQKVVCEPEGKGRAVVPSCSSLRLDQAQELLEDMLQGKAVLSEEALAQIGEHALQTDSSGLMDKLETVFKEMGARFPAAAGERLLKFWVKSESPKAGELFQAMAEAGLEFPEYFCRYIMSRCAVFRHVALADQVANYLRSRGAMTFVGYKTLMKVYSLHGHAGKGCDLYPEIKAKGWALDNILLASLIKLATVANRTDIIQELRGLVCGASASCYMLMVRALGQEGDIEGALHFFRRAFKECKEPIELTAYNMMLDVLVANKELERAYDLLGEMTDTNYVPSLVTFNTLIKGHQPTEDLAGAVKLLGLIDSVGLTPDMVTFRSLLCCATKPSDCEHVATILKRMEAAGKRLDVHTLVVLMQLARRCPHEQAQELLSTVESSGSLIFQDVIGFNLVLDVCIVHRDQRRLAFLVDAFGRSALAPDVRTYGLLIKANSLLHRTRCSLEWWQRMVDSKRVAPNGVALGCIIDALVEAHQVDDAFVLFENWKRTVACDTIIYSTLIKGFTASGEIDRAMALYGDMKRSGIELNAIVYSTLINAHAKDGNTEVSEQLLEDMRKENIAANAFTYSSMIRGYSFRKDLDAALRMYRKAREDGFKTNSVIYNTMLDGCTLSRNWKLADEVLADFDASCPVGSNYTVSIVVKMWSKRGNLDKAFATLRKALADPTLRRVDSQVGACIIGACMHNRAPLRALEVYREMATWKKFEGVDANTFSALIGGLVRFGYIDEAVQVTFEASEALKVTPGHDQKPLAATSIKPLFQALRQRGLLATVGATLAWKLEEAGTHVNQALLFA